jgi:UDP-N-acetylglucosamine 3-dehydrogenase
MVSDQFSVGLIGVGYWGPNYVRLISRNDRLRLKLVCDKDPSRFGEKGVKKSGASFSTDPLEAMKADVDVIVLSTPASTHYELCRKALERGKHVLVEKPLALSTEEAKELFWLARSRGVVLMAGLVYLYNAAVKHVVNHIRGRTVLHSTYLRTGLGPVRSDVNCVWDLAIHDFALSCLFTSEFPETVWGMGAKLLGPSEDVAVVWLQYKKSVSTIKVSWLDPLKRREISLVTERDMIVFDDVDAFEPIRIYERGVETKKPEEESTPFKFYVKNGPVYIPYVEYGEPLEKQLERFVERVDQKQIPFTWEDQIALRSVAMAEAVNQSIGQNGKIVKPVDPVATYAVPEDGGKVSRV